MLLSAVGIAAADEILPPVSQRFTRRDSEAVPDFQKHVVPLIGRLGCNSAKCHGSFQGKGGFRLSLFGFDFQSDHAALRGDALSEAGLRLDVNDPTRSLIVLKPTEQLDHEGGKRFGLGSWEHHLLLRWIETGAKGSSQVTATRTRRSEFAADDVAFFKESIQPILENHCYECHGFGSRRD